MSNNEFENYHGEQQPKSNLELHKELSRIEQDGRLVAVELFVSVSDSENNRVNATIEIMTRQQFNSISAVLSDTEEDEPDLMDYVIIDGPEITDEHLDLVIDASPEELAPYLRIQAE